MLLVHSTTVRIKLEDLENRIEITFDEDNATWHLNYLNRENIYVSSKTLAVEDTSGVHPSVRYQFKAAVVRGENGNLLPRLVKKLIDELYEEAYAKIDKKRAGVPVQRIGAHV